MPTDPKELAKEICRPVSCYEGMPPPTREQQLARALLAAHEELEQMRERLENNAAIQDQQVRDVRQQLAAALKMMEADRAD